MNYGFWFLLGICITTIVHTYKLEKQMKTLKETIFILNLKILGINESDISIDEENKAG